MTPKNKWIHWPFGTAATLGLITFYVLFSLLWLGLWKYDPLIFRENGPMENVQAGMLFLGTVFLAGACCKSKGAAPRILFCGLMLLYITMLIRELDFRSTNMPRIHFWLHGRVRNVWLGFCWVVAFLLFLKNGRAVWQEFLAWLRQPSGALLLLAGGAWLLGGVFDRFKPFDNKDSNFLVEELFEINAAASMLASAGVAARLKSHNAPAPPPPGLASDQFRDNRRAEK